MKQEYLEQIMKEVKQQKNENYSCDSWFESLGFMDRYDQAAELKKAIKYHFKCFRIRIKLHFCPELGQKDYFIFKVHPMEGTRVDSILKYAADVQIYMHLPVFNVFIQDFGIYLAVSKITPQSHNDLLPLFFTKDFMEKNYALPLAIGYGAKGEPVIQNLMELPHLMAAGSTYSGKSVALINIILSLICSNPVTDLRLVIFDINAGTLNVFDDVPHLITPIIKDEVTGIKTILKLNEEWKRRNDLPIKELEAEPYLVCVLDEYVSFISDAGDKQKQVAEILDRLARQGRHVKMHLVIATQNPTQENLKLDVNNFHCRMGFRCAKPVNSVAILGEGGAEKLPGKGAMLFKSPDYMQSYFIQGAYASKDVVRELIARVISVNIDYENDYALPEITMNVDNSEPWEDELTESNFKEDVKEEMLINIIRWAIKQDTVAADRIKKTFHIGNVANDYLRRLEEWNIIGPKNGNQARTVLVSSMNQLCSEAQELFTRHGVVMPITKESREMSENSNASLKNTMTEFIEDEIIYSLENVMEED